MAVPLAALYHTLLFLHILSAVMLVATAVIFTALGLGIAMTPRTLSLANLLWAVGGLGVIVFGLWLAINLSQYHPWDGWVIAAIVLWALATETGRRAQAGFVGSPPSAEGFVGDPVGNAMTMHWVRTVLVLALLVVMIYRPGA
jgi:hypothetical protein